jgi:dihydrofolate synthase / folylpolyglutamate synthase
MDGIGFINSLPGWDGRKRFDLVDFAQLMTALGNPQDRPRAVHIAGTNGKGSAAAAVASILGVAGNRVGLMTSPHLMHVNERIVVDGIPISDGCLSECILRTKHFADSIGVQPSYFEYLVAAGFIACEKCDWIVVEVGLGGRLDATNVLSAPKACAIVSIGWDHENILWKFFRRNCSREGRNN